MQTKMVPCPHCGTYNSAQKRVCYHCKREIVPQQAAKKPIAQIRPLSEEMPAPAATTPRVPHISIRQRAIFYRQLEAQIHAGITIGQCVAMIEPSCPAACRPMIRNLARRVQDGERLSAAMINYPTVFPEWELSVVDAGERGGTLPEAFRDIAEALETEEAFRAKIQSQTLHLQILIFVLLFVVLLALRVRVVVAYLLHTGGQITSLLEFREQFQPVFQVFALCVLGYLFVKQIWRMLSRTRKGMMILRPILHHTPLIGEILAKALRLRFISVLASLWHAGVPPMEALESAARASDDPGMMQRISAKMEEFGKGMSLSAILAATGYFPNDVMYLLNSGEVSGSIPEMLRKITEYLRGELDAQMKTLPMKLMVIMYGLIAPIVCYIAATTWRWFYDTMIGLFD